MLFCFVQTAIYRDCLCIVTALVAPDFFNDRLAIFVDSENFTLDHQDYSPIQFVADMMMFSLIKHMPEMCFMATSHSGAVKGTRVSEGTHYVGVQL